MNVEELQRQVENKFAPAPLLALQALTNTFAHDTEEERLGDPPAARRWLVESDLARSDVVVGTAEFRRLREFRELVRRLVEANLEGSPGAESRHALSLMLADHPVELTTGEDGRLTLDLDPVSTVDELISQFVGIIFRSQLESQWSRLKICASDDCRWAFYDSSRNRGGTWCQMEVCGNRVKNRRYRRRAGVGDA